MATIEYFDFYFLSQLHQLATMCGEKLTLVMQIISLTGNKGLSMFIMSFIMMYFPKTRRAGASVCCAVGCGTVLGNGILKFLIARPRPFIASAIVYEWWKYVGAAMKTSSSFPSGHMMAITAGMFTLYIVYKKKIYIILTVILSVLMGISRCYLMVHYPSDIVGGIIIGIISAIIGVHIINYIYDKKGFTGVMPWER